MVLVNLPSAIPYILHPDQDRMEQIYQLVGFWLEAFIYGSNVYSTPLLKPEDSTGVYFVLFFAAVHLIVQRRGRDRDHLGPQLVFCGVAIFMFMLTTVFTAVNIYRFIEAYALGAGPLGIPVFFFKDFRPWENYTYVITSSLLIWTADVLVIYRCYIIWDKNPRVIALPCTLLFISISINLVNIYWFQHPWSLSLKTIRPFLDFVYPGHLAQNILTTGLIAYKIWRQHLLSEASGVRAASGITLLSVVRLVVESAMVYTLQLTTLVVLYFLKHPAMVILQAAIVPSIGIVFVLLSIRVHMATLRSERLRSPASIALPSWVHGTESAESSGRSSFEVPLTRNVDPLKVV
ncbi:hypothetical protein DFP72DRAFT_321879 [Ephemerocybe angulata]|uniref:Uncharacterized protein n=1 Tax=Ephemerocybe angulata TaxID=980116 RepID=A0A8H6IFU3_9AGAR|nr:hypothetical protein DFP72DRAFT_321879 [Tulosesus angulatus]